MMILFGRNKTSSERTKSEGYKYQVEVGGENERSGQFKSNKLFLQAMCLEEKKWSLAT